jgi:methyltransferase (TIGR00027 family)
MTDKSSPEKPASGTAQAVAFLRALAAHDPRPAIRGRDTLAEIFLEADQQRPLHDPALRLWTMTNKISRGAYEFMIARTAFFDGLVEQALTDNIGQLVWLGAGYDSRPYRFAGLIRDTRLFELDAASTQQRKQACLRQAGIALPAQLCFVPIDFETQNLGATLLAAGFSRERPTLFIWEGVTYYLSSAAVDALLAVVSAMSPVGSSICFDYCTLSEASLADSRAGSKHGLRQHMRTNHADEPARFGIRAGQIEAFLAARGFDLTAHVSAAEMESLYLAPGSGAQVDKIPGVFCLVQATVRGGL